MQQNHGHDIDSLDIYREPVKQQLLSDIKELGHDPYEVEPVIDKAIDLAIERIKKRSIQLINRLLRANIEQEALVYIQGVLTQSKKWDELRQLIRSYGSLFVVGAGISFETGIPLTTHLQHLLNFCGAPDYISLRTDDMKCQQFKSLFKKICDDKQVSKSHRLICKNFPSRIIEIICLNWDNLIERAAVELGRSFPKINQDISPTSGKGYLWKIHGDVDMITSHNFKGKGGWIFPDEPGYVFKCFDSYKHSSGLQASLFVIVIVGYSERDKNVVEVLHFLQTTPQRPTFRIGLDLKRLHEKRYIVGPSDYVLQKVFS